MSFVKCFVAFCLSIASFSVFALPENPRRNLIDAMTGSFYTGCIQGFMVTYENGWYKRPEGQTAESMFLKIKTQCKQAAADYRKELG